MHEVVPESYDLVIVGSGKWNGFAQSILGSQ
jgi:hypothetical protein